MPRSRPVRGRCRRGGRSTSPLHAGRGPDKAPQVRPRGAQCRARRRRRYDRGAYLLWLCGDHPCAARGLFFSPRIRAFTRCQQISIETAQSKLDCAVLEKLPGKTILLGVLDLSDMAIEMPEQVAARIRRALPQCSGRAHHRRARLRAQIPPTRRPRSAKCRRWCRVRRSCARR